MTNDTFDAFIVNQPAKELTVRQLDAVAGKYAGSGTCFDETARAGEEVDLDGGWRLKWIRKGLGNMHSFILIPQDKRTRGLHQRGTVKFYMDKLGVTRVEAEALYTARIRFKFNLLDELGRVLKDEELHSTLLSAPRPDSNQSVIVKGGGIPDKEQYFPHLNDKEMESLVMMVHTVDLSAMPTTDSNTQ